MGAHPGVEAVIFDWGGTLTPWHTIDFDEESRALAAAVADADESAARLLASAVQTVWGRARDHHTSATLVDIFTEAGLVHEESLLTAYREFWSPHTHTDPDVPELFRRLRGDGVRIGVLSNTVWPREWHEDFFRRCRRIDTRSALPASG